MLQKYSEKITEKPGTAPILFGMQFDGRFKSWAISTKSKPGYIEASIIILSLMTVHDQQDGS